MFTPCARCVHAACERCVSRCALAFSVQAHQWVDGLSMGMPSNRCFTSGTMMLPVSRSKLQAPAHGGAHGVHGAGSA